MIAVTHMRLGEDLAVSDATAHGDEKVDLLLGGHDHEVACRFAGDKDDRPEVILEGRQNEDVAVNGQLTPVEGNVRIVKSGTNWRGYSVVRLVVGRREDGKSYLRTVKRVYAIDPQHIQN